MAEHRTLGESDWEDEDLLTFEEAGERLRDEIAAEEAIIAAADVDPASPTVSRARERIASMKQHLARAQAALASGAGTVRRINRS